MSSEQEKVLAQADIDALVALVPDEPRAATVAAPTSPPPPKPAAPPVTARQDLSDYEQPAAQAYSSNEVENIQTTINDLIRQVSKLTNMAQKLDALEKMTEQMRFLLKLAPGEAKTLGEQIAEIHQRLDEIFDVFQNRRDLRDDFQCEHCQSKSLVAFHAKCTSCGKENWLGWWPKDEKKTSADGNLAKPG